MIIDLSQSTLFTIDPGVRFAKEYAVPEEVWRELWRRYKLLEYSNGDLRDYLFVKHGRNVGFDSMKRWLFCGEVYMKTRPILEKGATNVSTVIFGDLEQAVIDELTRQLRYGRSANSKAII